jgi:beta-glucosidase
MTTVFRGLPIGAWHTLRVPLACLAERGADLSNVSAPFTVETGGRLRVEFTDAHFAHSATAARCPAPVD